MVLDAVIVAEIAFLLLLLLASAFFALSETALISANRLRIRAAREAGDPRAATLERLLRKPERIITTVLVGNNFVNIVASVLAAVVAENLLGEVGPAVATGLMVFVILLLCEITPKTFAVRHANSLALRIARPMELSERALAPLVWFLNAMAGGLLRAAGVKRAGRTPFITEEEIKLLVRVGEEQGTVGPFERRVISEVFDFTQTKAHRVMTPRDQITYLRRDATLHDAVQLVNQSGYSRVLVVDGSLDHALGFIHAKDLLRFPDEVLRWKRVDEVLRPVLHVQAQLETHDLLTRMQRQQTQLAVVHDSLGATIGILTLEDLLEELVGEIHDEFDTVPPAEPRPSAADAPAAPPSKAPRRSGEAGRDAAP